MFIQSATANKCVPYKCQKKKKSVVFTWVHMGEEDNKRTNLKAA